ncbi:hypothetical protein MPL3356_340176 [Mesorhizobium plurifarium]|uniref:Uncharacterized protein n=1 Tax=Mesorhizobium plurifarium TaxID=69974 RepID=A0A090E2Q9_MESPL|nr:hypothetical protein MPL3356_340176 [Mesorhizobium plurifarium]
MSPMTLKIPFRQERCSDDEPRRGAARLREKIVIELLVSSYEQRSASERLKRPSRDMAEPFALLDRTAQPEGAVYIEGSRGEAQTCVDCPRPRRPPSAG